MHFAGEFEPRDSSCRLYAGVPVSREDATLPGYHELFRDIRSPGVVPLKGHVGGAIISMKDPKLVLRTGMYDLRESQEDVYLV